LVLYERASRSSPLISRFDRQEKLSLLFRDETPLHLNQQMVVSDASKREPILDL